MFTVGYEIVFKCLKVKIWWLAAVPLSQRPGFNPRPIHVRFIVDKVALGQVFLRVLRFPLSVPFHQCSRLTFISVCSYQNDNATKAGNLRTEQYPFG